MSLSEEFPAELAILQSEIQPRLAWINHQLQTAFPLESDTGRRFNSEIMESRSVLGSDILIYMTAKRDGITAYQHVLTVSPLTKSHWDEQRPYTIRESGKLEKVYLRLEDLKRDSEISPAEREQQLTLYKGTVDEDFYARLDEFVRAFIEPWERTAIDAAFLSVLVRQFDRE